jgi:hypothetical protein
MVSFQQTGNFFSDKEFIGAGPNGKVVVTWTKFYQGPHGAGYLQSPIVMAISRDHGHTWNNQGRSVSDPAHPFDSGSMPLYGPDGALYVAYEGGQPSTGYSTDATIVARRTWRSAASTTTSTATRSSKGRASSSTDGFASERRLTSEGSNPFVQFADGSFIGDYSQAAVGSNGVVHTAWTDFPGRPGVTSANQGVYVANFTP